MKFKSSLFYPQFLSAKLVFIIVAVCIVLTAMFLTHFIVDKLKAEERSRMEIWAEATRQLAVADEGTDMTLVSKEINGNKTIPVVIVNENDELVNEDYGIKNIILPDENREEFIRKAIQRLKKANSPIVVQFDDGSVNYVYYDVSSQIKNLSRFSYTLFGVVSLFLVVAFMFFSHAKKTEQNQVWVGLSKETAHQLGTPISSLLAWVEILQNKYADETLIPEMSKDVNRLRIIAERFSKIGSKTELDSINLRQAINNALLYLKNRTSSKIEITTHYLIDEHAEVLLNLHLFEWVIENLYKNAVDAMDGEGKIGITVLRQGEYYCIDMKDTGKGIPKSKFDTVFKPGYTSKKRGWGLGLSLAKRIVEDYHHGKIYVKQSELNKGTTFRILLKSDLFC